MRSKAKLVVFDLDRTLVTGNCSFDFCKFLVLNKVLPFSSLLYSLWYFIRHTFFKMSLQDLHRKVFKRLLAGKQLGLFEAHVPSFLQSYLSKHLYPPLMNALQIAEKAGDHILILSNSPSFLVKQVADFLKVSRWKSTEYSVDQQNCFCDIAFIMEGKDKAIYVQELAERLSVKKKDITAYSDSYLDLPLLLSVGRPIAVNPDRRLRRFCKKQHWCIL